MTTKTKLIISAVALVSAFSIGRYSAPKTPEVKQTVKEETKQTTDKKKKVVIVTEPDGKKTTTITEDTTTVKETDKQTKTQVIPPKQGNIHLNLMVGPASLQDFRPIYGLSVSARVIGPFTAGLYGMSDSRVGVTVGVTF